MPPVPPSGSTIGMWLVLDVYRHSLFQSLKSFITKLTTVMCTYSMDMIINILLSLEFACINIVSQLFTVQQYIDTVQIFLKNKLSEANQKCGGGKDSSDC